MPGKADTSIDGFLDNGFSVIQPTNGAHRSGLDAILLAAAIPGPTEGNVAEFGSGCGAAGMAVAQRCVNTRVDLIEINPMMTELNRQSLELPQNRHLASRVKVIEADIALSGKARAEAGLVDNAYEYIISNPPYNGDDLQTSPNADKAHAHVMVSGLLEAWIKTASVLAKPKANLTLILRPQIVVEVLEALGARFGSVRLLPIHSKSATPASRLIVMAKKGGKAPLQILPPIVIHGENGGFTDQAEAIFRGRVSLFDERS